MSEEVACCQGRGEHAREVGAVGINVCETFVNVRWLCVLIQGDSDVCEGKVLHACKCLRIWATFVGF